MGERGDADSRHLAARCADAFRGATRAAPDPVTSIWDPSCVIWKGPPHRQRARNGRAATFAPSTGRPLSRPPALRAVPGRRRGGGLTPCGEWGGRHFRLGVPGGRPWARRLRFLRRSPRRRAHRLPRSAFPRERDARRRASRRLVSRLAGVRRLDDAMWEGHLRAKTGGTTQRRHSGGLSWRCEAKRPNEAPQTEMHRSCEANRRPADAHQRWLRELVVPVLHALIPGIVRGFFRRWSANGKRKGIVSR